MKKKVFSAVLVFSFVFVYGSVLLAKKIPKSEEFKFVCSEFGPYEYTNSNGKLTGFSLELLRAILKEVKVKDNIKIYPWSRVYQMVQKEKNVLAFTMTRNKEREKMFKWVGPIAPRNVYLWQLKSRKDVKIKKINDAKKYKIGTESNSASELDLIRRGFKKGKNIEPVHSMKLNYRKLFRKRIDFLCDLELSVVYGLKKEGLNPKKIKKSVLLSSGLKYYYAFNKNTPDYIVKEFNRALQKLKKNGTYDRIKRKYMK